MNLRQWARLTRDYLKDRDPAEQTCTPSAAEVEAVLRAALLVLRDSDEPLVTHITGPLTVRPRWKRRR